MREQRTMMRKKKTLVDWIGLLASGIGSKTKIRKEIDCQVESNCRLG
jgi:hypothetical protein